MISNLISWSSCWVLGYSYNASEDEQGKDTLAVILSHWKYVLKKRKRAKHLFYFSEVVMSAIVQVVIVALVRYFRKVPFCIVAVKKGN